MQPADWIDVSIHVSVSQLDTAAAAAQMVSNSGLYIEDYSDLEAQVQAIAKIDLIEQSLLDKARDVAVIHLYLPPDEAPGDVEAELMQRLTDAGVRFSLQTAAIQESDWANAWKDHYHFFALSSRLAVCPTWETCTPAPGQVVMRLDPGMAFGSGTHETTRLCLSLMELFLKPEHSVLDIGCGSGILAVAAALLGANRVVGVDIDPVAVRTARENAANNDVGATFIEGDLNAGLPGPFDLVCANIVADVIIRLAPDIPALLAQNGVCILSGIIAERAADVLQALLAAGLMPAVTRETGGWVAFACKICPSDKQGA